jgi:hypothetical protein
MIQDIIPYTKIHLNKARPTVSAMYHEPVLVVSNRPVISDFVRKVTVETTVIEPSVEVTLEETPMVRPVEALSAEEKVRVLERALFRARLEERYERRRSFLRRRTLA